MTGLLECRPTGFARDEIEQTLAQRFETVATRHGTAMATSDEKATSSYAELDALSTHIANAVTQRATDSTRPVVVLMPSGMEIVSALLGVLKAGCAYVPLDPSWPQERLASLIALINPQCLLFDSSFDTAGFDLPGALSFAEACAATPSEQHFSPAATDLAAIYSTSGSTGIPKCVALSHRSILNTTWNYVAQMQLTSDDHVLWLSPAAFGASMMSIFGSLLSGATLHRYEIRQGSISGLVRFIEQHRITVLHCTTSLFRSLIQTQPETEKLRSLRLVKVGGESLFATDVDSARKVLPLECVLLNGLGITECGGNVCLIPCLPDMPEVTGVNMPVGYALNGFELDVIDSHGQSVSPGTTGEIVVSSSYLANGYYGQPELTRDFFGDTLESTTLTTYHTGDLGWLDNHGCLTHVGRRSGFLNIRGHRVDVGEIEAALLKLPEVCAAAACERDVAGQTRLICFVEQNEDEQTNESQLRSQLITSLPVYMMPSRIITLTSLPRLESGKIDRPQLALQPIIEQKASSRTAAPRNTIEAQLVSLWERQLNVRPIGITENFFELGGDSLSAAMLFAYVEKRFDVELPLVILAKFPTIEGLAAEIRRERSDQPLPAAVLLSAGMEETVQFFCIPGAGSDVLGLLDLARAMTSKIAFYGFQYPGLEPGTSRFRSVPELAKTFISEMKSIQPRGPYRIGGSSFGGWIAFEMAQQLRQQGEEVDLLALLDTHGPGYPRQRSGLGIAAHMELGIRWCRPLGRREDPSLTNLWRGLRGRVHRLLARIRLQLIPDRTLPLRLRHIHLQETCFKTFEQYRPSTYPGTIHLYRAEQREPCSLYEMDEDLCWGTLVEGDLLIQDTPGSHGKHIRPPHVKMLARNLSRTLEDCLVATPTDWPEYTQQTPARWKSLADWWDQSSKEGSRKATQQALLPMVERQLKLQKTERVLDIACGNGWLSRRLSKLGARVTGVDLSEELLAAARTETTHDEPSVEFLHLNASDPVSWLQIASNSHDAAVCYMALMDIPEIAPLFEAMRRILVPKGRFVFAMALAPQDKATLGSHAPFKYRFDTDQPEPLLFFPRSEKQLAGLALQNGMLLEKKELLELNGESYLVGRFRRQDTKL